MILKNTANTEWRHCMVEEGSTNCLIWDFFSPPNQFKFSLLAACHSHQSHSSRVQCRWRGGGSWPGSRCLLCPARRSESGSCCHGAHWSPTHTPCCLGMSPGNPERTESHCWGQAHWGHSHHLQDNTSRKDKARVMFNSRFMRLICTNIM